MSARKNMGDMKAALSERQTNVPQTAVAPTQQHAALTADWGKKVNYDYNENNEGVEWEAGVKVYEWDGDEGELGPEHPELEEKLFGQSDARDPQGINFDTIDRINVIQEGLERIHPINAFQDAGLHPAMLRNVELMGYKSPTPIQRYCIPTIKLGYDLLAIAQTGSGKTAAYLIPIINFLMGKAKKLAAPRPSFEAASQGSRVRAEPLVVIVVPSRELAVQIFNEARKFCYRTMLRPCVVYGGCPTQMQIDNVKKGCDILVASPGRLVDLLERPNVLSFRRVRYMVIDEADEMLDSDWQADFNKILGGGEQEEGNVKYMLFSATFPTPVRQLAKEYLAEKYIRIKVGRVGSTHGNIKQEVVWVNPENKKKALLDLMAFLQPARTIIFVNGKRTADELDDFLFNNLDMPCTSMHSDRTQREREDAMRAFRGGNTPILIATGLTARGIDVRNVMYVINYDLPSMEHGGIQEYIHRIGRTGRMGHHGLATSFYCEHDEPIAELLTMTLMETGQEIPDFLERYKPAETDVSKLKFEYNSDEEVPAEAGDHWGATMGAVGNDGWGGNAAEAAGGGDGWGGNAAAKAVGGNDGQGFKPAPEASGENNGWASKPTPGVDGDDDGWGGEPTHKVTGVDDGYGPKDDYYDGVDW
ncbi:P-loop containing nucleoside triphosphate hydrolase protein [Xylaria nigripes]|nr:P-loop containing nucleoside triphosphate hydrolase protein [Xylaria nigripes]